MARLAAVYGTTERGYEITRMAFLAVSSTSSPRREVTLPVRRSALVTESSTTPLTVRAPSRRKNVAMSRFARSRFVGRRAVSVVISSIMSSAVRRTVERGSSVPSSVVSTVTTSTAGTSAVSASPAADAATAKKQESRIPRTMEPQNFHCLCIVFSFSN